MGKDDDKVAKTLTSVGIGAGLILTSIICPPLGAAVTTTYAVAGVTTKVAGKLSENNDLEEAGDVMILATEIGAAGSGAISVFSGGATHAACAGCKGLPWGKV